MGVDGVFKCFWGSFPCFFILNHHLYKYSWNWVVMKIGFLLLSFLVNIAALVIISYRNGAAFRVLGESIRLGEIFLINNFLYLIGYLTPFRHASAISAPLLYKYKYNVAPHKTYSVLFIDIMLYLFIQAVVLVLFYKYIPSLSVVGYWKLVGAAAIAVLLSLVIWKVIKSIRKLANDLISDVKSLIRNKLFVVVYSLINLIFVFLMPMMLHFILIGLQVNADYETSFIAYWLSLTVGFISGIPGGFGARDVTMGSILMLLLKMDLKTSALAVFLYRVISTAPHVIFGVYYMAKIGKDIKNFIWLNKIKGKPKKPEDLMPELKPQE